MNEDRGGFRQLLLGNPSPKERIKRFLLGRFGQNPDAKTVGNLISVFDDLNWVHLPRLVFQDDARDPNASEKTELANAMMKNGSKRQGYRNYE